MAQEPAEIGWDRNCPEIGETETEFQDEGGMTQKRDFSRRNPLRSWGNEKQNAEGIMGRVKSNSY